MRTGMGGTPSSPIGPSTTSTPSADPSTGAQ